MSPTIILISFPAGFAGRATAFILDQFSVLLGNWPCSRGRACRGHATSLGGGGAQQIPRGRAEGRPRDVAAGSPLGGGGGIPQSVRGIGRGRLWTCRGGGGGESH